MDTSRWSDRFLDSLRREGDSRADESLKAILAKDELATIAALFRKMDSNDEVPPATTFPALADFFRETHELPHGVDLDRVHRGEDVFIHHVFVAALVLLTKSLPEGYAAPNLSIILNISGQLRTHPYRRLLATLQTVVNVSTCHGFQAGGRAVITAQKLRLLHAGIRHLTGKYRPDYASTYGVPVNQEDMLGTMMGFSLLVIKGLRILHAGLSRAEEEDYMYMWLVFARMMGIYPAAHPQDLSYVPDNIDDAEAFYERYAQRHYVNASRNPDGVKLAIANLAMLQDMIPKPFRSLGFRVLPRIYMQGLMGLEGMERLSIAPVRGDTFLKWILLNLFRIASPIEGFTRTIDAHFGMKLFQHLIDAKYGGDVTFTIPVDLADLKGIDKE